jgi:hypothetical protein
LQRKGTGNSAKAYPSLSSDKIDKMAQAAIRALTLLQT